MCMEFLIRLVELAGTEMEIPLAYGRFHLMFVAITVIASILMCVFFRNVICKRCEKCSVKSVL